MSTQLEEKEGKQQPKGIILQQRTYTDTEKASALAHLDMNDGLLSKTSRETGIPVTTLWSWDNGRGISPRVVEMRKIKREELGEELRKVAMLGARLAQEKIVDAEFRDLMVGTGIAVQRSAELLGENVAIVEHRGEGAISALERLLEIARQRQPDYTRNQLIDGLIEEKPELRPELEPLRLPE